MKKLFTFLVLLLTIDIAYSQLLTSENKYISKNQFSITSENNTVDMSMLLLSKITGELKIFGQSAQPTFDAYFIVPISYDRQAPLVLDIDCPELINYKFIHLDDRNTVVVARLNNSPDTININWTSWVLTRNRDYHDYPDYASMPSPEDIPDSIAEWIRPSSCVPYEDPFINHIIDSITGLSNDLISLSNKTNNYCFQLPWIFPIVPESFGAYYAMKWGNSCTGHAHAAAAILRANGIPTRILLDMPLLQGMDQHWVIEYYIPDYGWAIMETSGGENPNTYSFQEIITFSCSIEDEFPLLYTDNMETYWFCSDTAFIRNYPEWGGAHSGDQFNCWLGGMSNISLDSIINIGRQNYDYLTKFKGTNLTEYQTELFQTAINYQEIALEKIKSSSFDSLFYYLKQANNSYTKIEVNETKTIFFDDFENGVNGWTTGGIVEQWQLGTPSNYGPDYTYSGNNCWGVNLDSLYRNNANCWLSSPSINLDDLATAFVEVKIWNDVEDSLQGFNPKDKLWLELSIDDGNTFFPISSQLGGVNDYNTGVPKVGGWSRLKLDLTPYVDKDVKIRFHFTSNESISRPGSYIDNFLITGRERGYDFINEDKKSSIIINAFPNPVTDILSVETSNITGNTYVSVINLSGQTLIRQQINGSNAKIDVRSLIKGIYLLKVEDNETCNTIKIVKN